MRTFSTGVRWLGVALVVVMASGCAPAEVRLADADVVHVSRNALLEDPASLPATGYLSTGQPNAAVLDLIAEAGYAAVVDVRGTDEERGIDERAEVETRGMRYISLPTPDLAAATPEQAATLAGLLAEIEGPVLLHCFSGNRVGSLFALEALNEGESADVALAFGERAGLSRWREEIKEKLESQ